MSSASAEPFALPWLSRYRWTVPALYVTIAIAAAIHRGVIKPAHTTFAIFRQSFVHLVHGTNVYASYPLEQGSRSFDLFKYSPTAAMLFAPLSLFPYPLALLGWDLFNALILCFAIYQVIPDPDRAALAALLAVPQTHVAVQASSSNALLTALIILSFCWITREKVAAAALSIAIASVFKIFPLAALTFIAFTQRRLRFVGWFVVAIISLILFPLLVISPENLAQQYLWWQDLLLVDAADISFGVSAMSLLRRVIGGTWPVWPLQLAGTVTLLIPLAMRRDAWTLPSFRRIFLASLLVYVVIFNHQAESPTYVIATTGAILWYCERPFTLIRTLLVGWMILGGRAFPALLVWGAIQFDLLNVGRDESTGLRDSLFGVNLSS